MASSQGRIIVESVSLKEKREYEGIGESERSSCCLFLLGGENDREIKGSDEIIGWWCCMHNISSFNLCNAL